MSDSEAAHQRREPARSSSDSGKSGEIGSAPAELQRFVSAEVGALLEYRDVDYAILDATRESGSAQAEREQVVRERLGAIAAIA
jgi:hypothetical protein